MQVTTTVNTKEVNFLDVTLDLRTGIYKPFMKENDIPTYVSCHSNHPPQVLKNIPKGVNRRLSKISATKEVFDAASPPYQEALKNSGYDHILSFEPQTQINQRRKNRKRNVLHTACLILHSTF